MVKILIVDDSALARSMTVQVILQGNVFDNDNTRFLYAPDGIAALEAFKIKKPQVVLTDWTMPNMDGYELIKKIREIDPLVPIVMISEESTPDRIDKATAKGMATDYIIKPLQPGVLEKKLLKAFEAIRSAQA